MFVVYTISDMMSREEIKKDCCTIFAASYSSIILSWFYGSTDKFSTAILAHLFCPLFARDPPHSFGYASGLPPQSDEKSTPIQGTVLSAIP